MIKLVGPGKDLGRANVKESLISGVKHNVGMNRGRIEHSIIMDLDTGNRRLLQQMKFCLTSNEEIQEFADAVFKSAMESRRQERLLNKKLNTKDYADHTPENGFSVPPAKGFKICTLCGGLGTHKDANFSTMHNCYFCAGAGEIVNA